MCNKKHKESFSKTQNYLVFCFFLILPFFFFIISKVFSYSLFQTRYFIPSIISIIVFYGLISNFINLKESNSIFIRLHYLYCLAVISYITYSYSVSYKLEDPNASLESISQFNCPVVTQSRRIAFTINQQGEKTAYQLVSDKTYAEHMLKFSNKLYPVPIANFANLLKKEISKYGKVIYISTPWVNENIRSIKQSFKDNKINFSEIPCIKTPQVSSIYLLTS